MSIFRKELIGNDLLITNHVTKEIINRINIHILNPIFRGFCFYQTETDLSIYFVFLSNDNLTTL